MFDTATRAGVAWRPWEQAPAEREHLEEQRTMGALLSEVIRCHPGQWAQALPLVEFIRYNTPNRTGLTPRDLCCGWPVASPLEKDLLVSERSPKESLADGVRTLFESWRMIRNASQKVRAEEAMKRRDSTNRRRGGRYPEVGDRVLLRDPKLSKRVAGHAPGMRPAKGPFLVKTAVGGRVTLEDVVSGRILQDQHADHLIYLPAEVQDYERIPLELTEDSPEHRPSLGQLLESRAKDGGASTLRPKDRRRKLAGLHVGRIVAYEGEVAKRLRIGKVTNLSESEQSASIHQFWPKVDSRLRVKWSPAFARPPEDDEGRSAELGGAVVETVPISKLITVVDLHDGVM